MAAWFHRRESRPGSATSRVTTAALLAIVVLTIFAFWPLQRNGFISVDDGDYITQNAVVKRGITAPGIVLAFTRSYAANWHPLTWVSHMLDVELFGLDPRAHHLVGLTIHLATALLLLATLQAMTGRTGPSFLVAALFAIHPLHVESVAWAAERKDVLAACLWVLTMAAYLRYAHRPGFRRFLPVLLLFILGLMSKPMVVTLPLVLLLLDYWPLSRFPAGVAAGAEAMRLRFATLLLEKTPLFALSLLAGLVTIEAQTTGGSVTSMATFPLGARIANALLSLVGYCGKAVWPAGLSLFYPFTIHPLTDPGVLAAGAALSAASGAAFFLRRRCPWLLWGWLWYLVTLLPVIGLVQVGDQAMADRYTYLPLVGVFVAGAWGLDAFARRWKAPRGALASGAGIVLILLAGLTRHQVALWKDEETLYRHATGVTTDNWWATYGLGLLREISGDRTGALQFYGEAIRMKPDFTKARYTYALLLDKAGRIGEATEQLRVAVHALPADQVIRMRLALLLIREGRDDEAIVNLRELIVRQPDAAEAYNNLAVLLSRKGKGDEAAALLRRALEIDPAYAEARLNLETLTRERSQAGPAP